MPALCWPLHRPCFKKGYSQPAIPAWRLKVFFHVIDKNLIALCMFGVWVCFKLYNPAGSGIIKLKQNNVVQTYIHYRRSFLVRSLEEVVLA